MIRKGILDYLKCLKYYFVPLGILSIFTLIGFYSCITGLNAVIKDFFVRAAEMAKAAKIDWNGIYQACIGEIAKVDYAAGLNAVFAQVTSREWLVNALTTVCKFAFGETLTVEQITGLLTQIVAAIVQQLLIFVVLVIIGAVVGYIVTRVLVRRELTKVKIGKLILYSILNALFWVGLLFLFNFIGTLNRVVSLVLLVIFLLSLPFFCLVEAYLFYGIKKIKFSKAANIKNVLIVYLISLIILAITAVTVVILILLFGIFIGLYIALPFIEIGIIAISLSAESYVVNLIEKENKPQIEEEKAEKIKKK